MLLIVGVSGSVRQPSRTTTLVSAILETLAARTAAETRLIDLGVVGATLFAARNPDQLSPEGKEALGAVETADILVAGSPVYRASYTGLFKHLFDLVGQEALAAKPVILAATGGSELHGLVIEHQFRPLFGFFGAFSVPTGVYATAPAFENDRVTSDAVRQRIERAAAEALALARVKLDRLAKSGR